MGLILDTSLMFDEHIKTITFKVSKIIGPLQKLNNRLPRSSLTIIYNSSVRPRLDCGDAHLIRLIIIPFNKDLNLFNTMHHWK